MQWKIQQHGTQSLFQKSFFMEGVWKGHVWDFELLTSMLSQLSRKKENDIEMSNSRWREKRLWLSGMFGRTGLLTRVDLSALPPILLDWPNCPGIEKKRGGAGAWGSRVTRNYLEIILIQLSRGSFGKILKKYTSDSPTPSHSSILKITSFSPLLKTPVCSTTSLWLRGTKLSESLVRGHMAPTWGWLREGVRRWNLENKVIIIFSGLIQG